MNISLHPGVYVSGMSTSGEKPTATLGNKGFLLSAVNEVREVGLSRRGSFQLMAVVTMISGDAHHVACTQEAFDDFKLKLHRSRGNAEMDLIKRIQALSPASTPADSVHSTRTTDISSNP